MKTLAKRRITFPENINAGARVWIYQANRDMTDEESTQIQMACDEFVSDWQTHGKEMNAANRIYFNRFICLFVNDAGNQASGCSIDASVHFIQALEKQYQMALTERTSVAYLDSDGEIAVIPLNELGAAYEKGLIENQTLVFDNLVATKEEMADAWMVPLAESWHAKMIR